MLLEVRYVVRNRAVSMASFVLPQGDRVIYLL